MLMAILNGYEGLRPLFENTFNETIFHASIDLSGYLVSAVLFELMGRKKLVFTLAYLMLITAIVGIFLTRNYPIKSAAAITNQVFTYFA